MILVWANSCWPTLQHYVCQVFTHSVNCAQRNSNDEQYQYYQPNEDMFRSQFCNLLSYCNVTEPENAEVSPVSRQEDTLPIIGIITILVYLQFTQLELLFSLFVFFAYYLLDLPTIFGCVGLFHYLYFAFNKNTYRIV